MDKIELKSSKDIFIRWTNGCNTPEQLNVLNVVIPDFFNPKRFPNENPNNVFLAKADLLLIIGERIEKLFPQSALQSSN